MDITKRLFVTGLLPSQSWLASASAKLLTKVTTGVSRSMSQEQQSDSNHVWVWHDVISFENLQEWHVFR